MSVGGTWPGEKAGVDLWVKELQNGMAKEHVLVLFAESAENSAAIDPMIDGGVQLGNSIYQ